MSLRFHRLEKKEIKGLIYLGSFRAYFEICKYLEFILNLFQVLWFLFKIIRRLFGIFEIF
jgi:hypothetical protein